MPRSELFLDASYAIALSVTSDLNHERALLLADELELNDTRLVTTRAGVLEIGNALSKLRFRDSAGLFLASIEDDRRVEIIGIAKALYDAGLNLYRERQDKQWGLTDCISFVVMTDRGLAAALTADDHFRQAGFRALLKEMSI
jgi:predicted nucleic acid-binding protein